MPLIVRIDILDLYNKLHKIIFISLSLLTSLFYIIQTLQFIAIHPSSHHNFFLPPQSSRLGRNTTIVAISSNQIIPFVFNSITIICVTISAHSIPVFQPLFCLTPSSQLVVNIIIKNRV